MKPGLLFATMFIVLLGAASCAGPGLSDVFPPERAERFDAWMPEGPRGGKAYHMRRYYTGVVSGRLAADPELYRLARGDRSALGEILSRPERNHGLAPAGFGHDLVFALFVVGDGEFASQLQACPEASRRVAAEEMRIFVRENRAHFPETAAIISPPHTRVPKRY